MVGCNKFVGIDPCNRFASRIVCLLNVVVDEDVVDVEEEELKEELFLSSTLIPRQLPLPLLLLPEPN